MNPEENDALWKLLGKADRKPQISPAFAQNVTRSVRQLGAEKPGFWRSLFGSNSVDNFSWLRPACALGTLAAVAVTAFFLLSGDPENTGGIVEGGGVAPGVIEDPENPGAVIDPVLEGFEVELELIDQLDSLVTSVDVKDFADEEIAMLLF